MNTTINNYITEKQSFDKALSALQENTGAIISIIIDVFGIKKTDYWWDWSYYEDNGHAKLPSIDEDGVDVYISVLLDDGYYFYNEKIPLIFYDMSGDDIKSFIKNNIEKKQKERLLQKEKTRQKNIEKKQKREKVLSKLSMADKKILGLVE